MILFIVALGLLLGALHWGKTYVARLRLEAQTASVRERWRAKAKNDPQLLVFAHALLFSTYAGLIGERLQPCTLCLGQELNISVKCCTVTSEAPNGVTAMSCTRKGQLCSCVYLCKCVILTADRRHDQQLCTLLLLLYGVEGVPLDIP